MVYAITITFAAIDWVMSLEPYWYSTMYPPLYAIGQVNGLRLRPDGVLLLPDRPPFAGRVTPKHLRDLGGLLLTFVMFWAYMAFSQFLLIWVGNLPEETPWYLLRPRGLAIRHHLIAVCPLRRAVPAAAVGDVKEHRQRC